jgi:CRISPR system Cascade subunit CasD
MSGLLLQLAGPMQSWGEHSAFGDRDTHTHPTRSGLIGLLAAALGLPRDADLTDLRALSFTIRIDRPGRRIIDFHTIGGGLPPKKTVPTAEGKRRGPDAATMVTRRHYLADAVFTIAVEGPTATIDACAQALRAPQWAPYLGRRSCPPSRPILLAVVADPVDRLETLPLAREDDGDPVTVTIVADRPTADGAAVSELTDEPATFAPRARRYAVRSSYSTTRTLPATSCAGYGATYLDQLAAYLERLQ